MKWSFELPRFAPAVGPHPPRVSRRRARPALRRPSGFQRVRRAPRDCASSKFRPMQVREWRPRGGLDRGVRTVPGDARSGGGTVKVLSGRRRRGAPFQLTLIRANDPPTRVELTLSSPEWTATSPCGNSRQHWGRWPRLWNLHALLRRRNGDRRGPRTAGSLAAGVTRHLPSAGSFPCSGARTHGGSVFWICLDAGSAARVSAGARGRQTG